jgi:5-methylcytosine-specific restriction endonuclease McrA
MNTRIVEMLREGMPYSKIAEETGVTKPTISWYAKKNGLSRGSKLTYDWKTVQAYYDKGHTLYDCIEEFGFCKSSWDKAIKRGLITPRRVARRPLDQIKNRGVVRRRLIRDGTLGTGCHICGLDEWLGEPISLQLDHINGDGKDHRLENLRFLCPNCHSQTDTFCGKNKKKSRVV